MELTIVQALLIALWVALIESRCLGYATLTLRFSPLMTGFVCGVVMGNVSEAMIVTATIQLIYMGAAAPGGTLPSEPAIAAAIAVPVALIGDLSPEPEPGSSDRSTGRTSWFLLISVPFLPEYVLYETDG